MDQGKSLNRLELHQNGFHYDHVDPVNSKELVTVVDWNWFLALERNAPTLQLDRERVGMDAFKEPRPEMAVDLEGAVNNIRYNRFSRGRKW